MRNKLLALTASIAATALIPSSLNAELLASEDFSYNDGLLIANNGGTGWSTAWGDANGNTSNNGMSVSGGVAATSSGNIFRGLDFSFGDHANIWISLDYQFNSGIFDGIQFFENTTERALIGNLAIGVPNAEWTLGKNGGTGDIAGSGVSSSTFKTGVVHYDVVAGTGSLWVGGSLGPVDISGAADAVITGLTIGGVNTVRLGTAGGSLIDNIRIGTTSSDVAAVIPEPGTTGILMGASILVMLASRRRR